jgi:hypothetical protein
MTCLSLRKNRSSTVAVKRDAIKMNALVNNKDALRVFLKDPTPRPATP